MIEKTNRGRRKIKGIFLFISLVFLSSKIPAVLAQDLPSVDASSVNADSMAGTPIDEIISAVSGGGLSPTINLKLLAKPEIVSAVPEMPVAAAETPGDPAPAGLNPDSLKYLESQGGISSSPQAEVQDPTIFKLAVKFLEQVVFRNNTEFAKRPKFDDGMEISGNPTFDKDTAGYAIIKKGNQSVVVDFGGEYSSSPVVTATLSLQQYKDREVRAAAEDLLLISDVKYIVTNVTEKGFEIMMDHEAYSDIPFSWHALAVDNPKTFKKAGDSTKDNNTPDTGIGTTGDNSPVGSGNSSSGTVNNNTAGASSPDGPALTSDHASPNPAPDSPNINNNSNPN